VTSCGHRRFSTKLVIIRLRYARWRDLSAYPVYCRHIAVPAHDGPSVEPSRTIPGYMIVGPLLPATSVHRCVVRSRSTFVDWHAGDRPAAGEALQPQVSSAPLRRPALNNRPRYQQPTYRIGGADAGHSSINPWNSYDLDQPGYGVTSRASRSNVGGERTTSTILGMPRFWCQVVFTIPANQGWTWRSPPRLPRADMLNRPATALQILDNRTEIASTCRCRL